MKCKMIALLGLTVCFWGNLSAQEKQPAGKVTSTRDCSDLNVHSKLIDLNKTLEEQHFKMSFFSSGNIPSKTLMSVRLDCKAGETYEIRYVLGTNATKYQLNVIDNNVRHIVKLKGKAGDNDLTVVNGSFKATADGVYVVVYSQQSKLDNCIGLSVFKK